MIMSVLFLYNVVSFPITCFMRRKKVFSRNNATRLRWSRYIGEGIAHWRLTKELSWCSIAVKENNKICEILVCDISLLSVSNIYFNWLRFVSCSVSALAVFSINKFTVIYQKLYTRKHSTYITKYISFQSPNRKEKQ